MKMNLKQTKIVGLTMELELKTKIFIKLCEKLEKLKTNNINENATEFIELKEMFEINNKEITAINNQLKALKENIDIEEKQHDSKDLFKDKTTYTKNTEEKQIDVIKVKKNIFIRVLEIIKKKLNFK